MKEIATHLRPPSFLPTRSTPQCASAPRIRRSFVRGFLVAGAIVAATAGGAHADEIDDYVRAQMERQHIPGLSLAVLRNGQPVKLQGYGVSNLELATAAAPETTYAIGSVSKQFIAAGVLLLSREGKLGLDDPIRKHLAEAPDTWTGITVRQLLSHTSGLVRETPGLQLKAQRDIDAIRGAFSTPLAFAPGEKWQYSNLGYFVLAELITRTAGVPWPQFLHARIFAPLGMNATRTTTVEDIVPHRATGYQWVDEARFQNAPVMPGVRPSGAFLSSVADLAKWDAALYSDQLLPAAERELMWMPAKLNDGTERPYGFGWELGKIGQHRQVKHAGTMLGFRSALTRFPDDGLTIIVLTNATQALPPKITQGVAEFYLPDLNPARARRTAVAITPEILKRYVGRYQLTASRSVTIARVNDRLAVSMPLDGFGPELDPLVRGVSMDLALLTAESPTRFFDAEDTRSTYVFSTDATGGVQFAIETQDGKQNQPARKLPAAR